MAFTKPEQLQSNKRKSLRQNLGSFIERENSGRSSSLFSCFAPTTLDDETNAQDICLQNGTQLNYQNLKQNQNVNQQQQDESQSQQFNSVTSTSEKFNTELKQDIVGLSRSLTSEQLISVQNQDVVSCRELSPQSLNHTLGKEVVSIQNSSKNQSQNKKDSFFSKVRRVSRRKLLGGSKSQQLDSKSLSSKFEQFRSYQNQRHDVLQPQFSEQTDVYQSSKIQKSKSDSSTDQFIQIQTSEIFATDSKVERFNALQPWQMGEFESFEDIDQEDQLRANEYSDLNGYYIQDNYNNNNQVEEDGNDSWYDAQSEFEEPDEQFSMIACQQDLQNLQNLRENLQDNESQEVNEVIDEIEQYIKNGQVELALKCWRTLQTLTGCAESIGQSLERWRATVEKGLEEIDDYEDYVKSWDHGLVLHYRHRRNSPLHSFKSHAFFEVHPVIFSSLLREFDLIHTWSPYVPESNILKLLAKFHSYVLASLWFPWPFKNRQMIYETTFFDVLEEKGCILLILKSLPQEKWESIPGFPENAWKRVTIDIVEGSCMKFTPRIVDGVLKGVDVMSQLHVNPHSFEIPRFVISFVITIFAPFMYKVAKNIVDQQLTKGKGIYFQRIKQNKYTYGYLTKRVNSYIQKIIDQEYEKVEAA